MFHRIIEFSIKNKAIIGFLVFVLIGFGIYSIQNIPVDAVPDITNNQVQVVTSSPSLSPQEVEKFITFPLETSFANIKDVEEIRSISRYGLSVITIVFKEQVPILNARQRINEQIQMASGEIPEGLGKPEMLPITTGLGEVYQYTLEVDSAYQDKYNPTKLRTIHDWIVKRQLAGISGIVEISSFGGFIKQYEISINPDALKNLNLTINDVKEALQKNNENTGSGYIMKGSNAYYIRAEGLLNNLDEIQNVVVAHKNGNPVLIEHVAEVKFGKTPRFGAMTKNGNGEAVGGITLMLRGANSSEVVKNVKKRVEEVQERLPEGVKIEPYLDRAALVKKTTGTLKTNLIEGGLIVIFILILLLGSYRSGIIVASVIPLSLLFAIVMMQIFGVSANLMSLGAIDFGIVIDGAVIIVESIVYHLQKDYRDKHLSQGKMDEVVKKSTVSIYKSAAFGVIIILIVFIPILTLTGVEGRMFRPMAQTFSFAILGAFLLSMTYVPMISSLFLKKKVQKKKNISDRFIKFLKWTYYPVLRFSLKNKKLIIIAAIVAFGVSIWSFNRLGGEFIPTLEEGDLAMQMTIPAGSSLDQSIKNTTRAEKILLNNFPEVEKVISKIGTAEVPTDPMPIEDADIMIILKDKDEWVSADDREELSNLMKEKLSVIPAASFDFTQPIQLRFNELMTGAKTDIALKIFGEDIDELYKQANLAADIVSGIKGAADIQVEKITGLPQYSIKYKRERLAQYGIDIASVNQTIQSAFAGIESGVIFEGERKFDLVIRLDSAHRRTVDLNKLNVRTSSGRTIPVSEVAEVNYEEGPIQISRDDTKRRVTVGVNVRNRDIQSLVEEIDSKLTRKLDLKPGYYIEYTGDFENLQAAKKRLSYAVPIALLLILILLFFTFNSFKYALLIFSAVPLSAVGGIAALWIRGMPFSISAGVGFIALFGVAVLNGIVLISYYNQLKEEGKYTIDEIVEKGACNRLRPVLMTASTDILGFLPMAISTSAGAEVQRPLATVVIGGIITATMLTMIMLPILYKVFNSGKWKPKVKANNTGMALLVMGLFIVPTLSFGQQQETKTDTVKTLTLEKSIEIAKKRNYQVRNAMLRIQQTKAEKQKILDLKPTEINYQKGQINSSLIDQYFEINQSIGSPIKSIYRGKKIKEENKLKKTELNITKKQITKDVKLAYFEWIFLLNKKKILKEELKLYKEFSRVAGLKNELGETPLLEKTTAEAKYLEAENKLKQTYNELAIAKNNLKTLLNIDYIIKPATDTLTVHKMKYHLTDSGKYISPLIKKLYKQRLKVSRQELNMNRAELFPEISAGYFNQQIDHESGFEGWMVGISIPLWFFPKKAEIQKAKIKTKIIENNLDYQIKKQDREIKNTAHRLNSLHQQILYFHNKGLEQADILIKTAQQKYNNEDIEYYEYMQSIKAAYNIKLNYLKTIKEYNQTASKLEFYIN